MAFVYPIKTSKMPHAQLLHVSLALNAKKESVYQINQIHVLLFFVLLVLIVLMENAFQIFLNQTLMDHVPQLLVLLALTVSMVNAFPMKTIPATLLTVLLVLHVVLDSVYRTKLESIHAFLPPV